MEKIEVIETKNLAKKTGISLRAIQFWTSEGIIVPEVSTNPKGRGRGKKNLYSSSNLTECLLIQELESKGIRLAQIFVVMEWLRQKRKKKDYFSLNEIHKQGKKNKNVYVIVMTVPQIPKKELFIQLEDRLFQKRKSPKSQKPSQVINPNIPLALKLVGKVLVDLFVADPIQPLKKRQLLVSESGIVINVSMLWLKTFPSEY